MLESGVYHISCKYDHTFHSTDEVVTLKIKDCPEPDPKPKCTVYNLSDLKDLESKIILIRDSGSSTVDGQSSEAKSSDNVQKAKSSDNVQKTKCNVSISKETSLVEKLSSKEIEGFLNVRI